jgi:hypothetical protein
MRISKAVIFIVAALCVGLPIAGSILLVGSQFHPPAHVETVEGKVAGRPAFVKEEPESYLEKWRDPVAQATLGLIGVTGLLAIFTYLLFRSAVDTARESKEASGQALAASTAHTEMLVKIDRAFLTGGGPSGDINGRKVFRLEVANYGKTPAFLCAFDVHFATLDAVIAGPQEVFPWYPYDDWIPPNRNEPRPIRYFAVPSKAQVVFGAFWYQDWQRRSHIFRFILRLERDTELGIMGVDDSYTYWD